MNRNTYSKIIFDVPQINNQKTITNFIEKYEIMNFSGGFLTIGYRGTFAFGSVVDF